MNNGGRKVKVSKVSAAGVQYTNGASGSTGAVYAATVDGVEVARFRPAGVRGYGRRSAWVRDSSGRRLEGRFVYTLAQFKAWAADGFDGAFVEV